MKKQADPTANPTAIQRSQVSREAARDGSASECPITAPRPAAIWSASGEPSPVARS